MSDDCNTFFMIKKGKEENGRRMTWYKNCIGENCIFGKFDNAFEVFNSLRKQFPSVQLLKYIELNGEISGHVVAQTWEDKA